MASATAVSLSSSSSYVPFYYVILDEPEFTSFPTLPTEIRLRIWEFASFLPRDLDVCVIDLIRDPTPDAFKFMSKCPVPAILHANHEARTQGLKYYKLAFGSRGEERPTPPRIYLNPCADRVCFTGQTWMAKRRIVHLVVLYKLCHLAINVYDKIWGEYCPYLESWPYNEYCPYPPMIGICLPTSTIWQQPPRWWPQREWLNGNIESITLYQSDDYADRFNPSFKYDYLDEEYLRNSTNGLRLITSAAECAELTGTELGALRLCLVKESLLFYRERHLNWLKSRPEGKTDENDKNKKVEELWNEAGDLSIILADKIYD